MGKPSHTEPKFGVCCVLQFIGLKKSKFSSKNDSVSSALLVRANLAKTLGVILATVLLGALTAQASACADGLSCAVVRQTPNGFVAAMEPFYSWVCHC